MVCSRCWQWPHAGSRGPERIVSAARTSAHHQSSSVQTEQTLSCNTRRPTAPELTAAVGRASSHDPGHDHCACSVVPPDGGALEQERARAVVSARGVQRHHNILFSFFLLF